MKIKRILDDMESPMHTLPYRSLSRFAFPIPLFLVILLATPGSAQESAAASGKNVQLEKQVHPELLSEPVTKVPGVEAKPACGELFAKEIVTHEESNADACAARDEGRKLFRKGNYQEAIDKFLEAKKIWDSLNASIPGARYLRDIEGMKKEIADTYYYWAQELYQEGKSLADSARFDAAAAKCRKAVEVYPPCKQIVEKAIADFEKMKRATEFANVTAIEAADPDFVSRKNDIEILLQQGRMFYKIGRWSKAAAKFEEAVTLDPYNAVANDYLRKIYIKLRRSGEARMALTAAERIDEAAWKPIAPILTETGGVDQTVEVQGPKLDETRTIRKKLENIRFKPPLIFENQPIDVVMKYLKQRSKELDEDKEGVNFVLRFNGEGGAAPAGGEDTAKEASEEGDAEEDGEDSAEAEAEEGASSLPLVTMSVVDKNISLLDAIKAVCQSANLRFRIEEYAVVIAGEGVPLTDLVTVVYPVDKEAIEGLPSGESDNPIKDYFIDSGVPFDSGANVVFDDSISRLIVTNTPENQEQIAERIKEMNINDPQIQLQVKFVEISMNDLEELGFEYLVERPQGYYTRAFSEKVIDPAGNETTVIHTATPLDNIRLSSHPVRDIAPGSYYTGREMLISKKAVYNKTSTTPHGINISTGTKELMAPETIPANSSYVIPDTGEYVATYLHNTKKSRTFAANDPLVRNVQKDSLIYGLEQGRPDTVFNWGYYDKNGYHYNAQIHALDQADSTNVLSSPRVTTMNGQQAVVKMVTKKYYPENWTESEMNTVNGVNVFVPSTPEFGDPVEEGITLDVTPSVTEDNYAIEVDMNPIILQFDGWTDYSYPIILEGGTYENTLKMPIFFARTVATHAVSEDGKTIVLGGIIEDKVNMVDDQYPILGDIPLVGRLFQSRGKGSQKTNLLIFLTNTLVTPDGAPIRSHDEEGLPTF